MGHSDSLFTLIAFRLSLLGRILQEGVPATSLTSLLRKGIPGVSIPVLTVNALLRRLQVCALAVVHRAMPKMHTVCAVPVRGWVCRSHCPADWP